MVEYACAMVLMGMCRHFEPITVVVTAGLWLRRGNKVEIVCYKLASDWMGVDKIN